MGVSAFFAETPVIFAGSPAIFAGVPAVSAGVPATFAGVPATFAGSPAKSQNPSKTFKIAGLNGWGMFKDGGHPALRACPTQPFNAVSMFKVKVQVKVSAVLILTLTF
jgi:hypothetical protein